MILHLTDGIDDLPNMISLSDQEIDQMISNNIETYLDIQDLVYDRVKFDLKEITKIKLKGLYQELVLNDILKLEGE